MAREIYTDKNDLKLFEDGSLSCITGWGESERSEGDVVLVPYSEVLAERKRCIEAFTNFDLEYALEFINSQSRFIPSK